MDGPTCRCQQFNPTGIDNGFQAVKKSFVLGVERTHCFGTAEGVQMAH